MERLEAVAMTMLLNSYFVSSSARVLFPCFFIIGEKERSRKKKHLKHAMIPELLQCDINDFISKWHSSHCSQPHSLSLMLLSTFLFCQYCHFGIECWRLSYMHTKQEKEEAIHVVTFDSSATHRHTHTGPLLISAVSSFDLDPRYPMDPPIAVTTTAQVSVIHSTNH